MGRTAESINKAIRAKNLSRHGGSVAHMILVSEDTNAREEAIRTGRNELDWKCAMRPYQER